MQNDFAIIIISHGRPECSTYSVLRECGYTGAIYIVLSDDDKKIPEYVEKYGERNLFVFHKDANSFDIMDNFEGPNSIATFARNATWDCAEKNGIKYFACFDDDLKSVYFRWVKDGKLKSAKATNLDIVFDATVQYMKSAGITLLGYGLPMDYIGGAERFAAGKLKRGVMNCFFCGMSHKFEYKGRYSEDTITPVELSQSGAIVLSHTGVNLAFEVWADGKNVKKGGCQDAYALMGDYVLRWYAVMAHPDCVIVRSRKDGGVDNTTKYNNAYPFILSEKVRKT